MYVVNSDRNNMKQVESTSFSKARVRERQHLQEWIAHNPGCLGEELLIIQKEFAGFDDTKERLDLLALDKSGNVVIIENKLDDTGKDVVWQALKYVSYCASLTVENIKEIYQSYLHENTGGDADQLLSDFFNVDEYEESINVGYSQRIILVSATFRKEVTSTVMWLLNNSIDITCIKTTPYVHDNNLLVDFTQIIPVKEAEEYVIKIAAKQHEQTLNQKSQSLRHALRMDFWRKFLDEANKQTTLTQNLSPSRDAWISVALGLSGVSTNILISKKYARTEIYINRGSLRENKRIFDLLYANKDAIETKFGSKLVWERMDDKVTCRIKNERQDFNVYDSEDHEDMISFLVTSTILMQRVFKPYITKIKEQ